MPCKCREGLTRWQANLKQIEQLDIGGLEKGFCHALYRLRLASILEWLSLCIVGGRGDDDHAAHKTDRLIVDFYVVGKTLLVALLMLLPTKFLAWYVQLFVWYLLAEMYVALLNVVIIGTLNTERKISVGRSLLLLMFNAIQLVLSFALFYRAHAGVGPWQAFVNSVHVFSTLALPDKAEKLETTQIILNFIFLAIILARFLGMPDSPKSDDR